jgi:hypothetical protein
VRQASRSIFPHRQLTELAESGHRPTLGVRELPHSESDARERRRS